MHLSNKVVLIGLDGVSFELIRPWAEQGFLPTLKKLMQESSVGKLRSTCPPSTMPAVPTFTTGKNPGKHGMYSFVKRDKDSYKEELVSSLDRKSKAVWSIASENGVRVGTFLMPFTYPPDKIENGFNVSGFGSELSRDCFSPEQLYDELKSHIPDFGDFELLRDKELLDDKLSFVQNDLAKITEVTTQIVKYLYRTYKPQLFMVWFDQCEKAHHYAWEYFDPRFPRYHYPGAEKYRDIIRDVYVKVDQALAEILKEIDADSNIIIMSDHGFGTTYKHSPYYHLNNWLLEKAYLKLKNKGLKPGLKYRLFSYENLSTFMAKVKLSSLLRRYRLGAFLRKLFLKNLVSRMPVAPKLEDIDWTKTQAYSRAKLGYIYLNLKDREPNGIVQKNGEYEDIREKIIEDFKKMVDPKTNKPTIDKLYTKEELYSGEAVDDAPDLVVMPKELPTYIKAGRMALLESEPIPSPGLISPNHKKDGILLLKGPRFRKNIEIKEAKMVDVAANILYLLGIGVPQDFDGRLWTEAFDETYLEARQTHSDANNVTQEHSQDDSPYRKDDEEKVRKRLQGMGYI